MKKVFTFSHNTFVWKNMFLNLKIFLIFDVVVVVDWLPKFLGLSVFEEYRQSSGYFAEEAQENAAELH